MCELSNETFRRPVLDVSTRWNFTFRMIEAAPQQAKALNMLIINSQPGSILKENALTDADWEEIRENHKRLKAFDVATKILIGLVFLL